MMEYRPTSASAIEFANAGRLEDWVHLFLRGEGGNEPFSDGLKLESRRYDAPVMMKLNQLVRCCGPESDMMFRVPKEEFEKHVEEIEALYREGNWDMPPLMLFRGENGDVLSDGNHRHEALRRLSVEAYWVIVIETVK